MSAVTSRKNKFQGLVVRGQEIATLNVIGNLDSGKFERTGGDVDVLDEVVPHRPGALLPRQPYDHGDANALFIEKLLAAQVADAVVGPEEGRGGVEGRGSLGVGE